MRTHRGRKAQWPLTSWPAAFLLLAAFGLPRAAQGAVCNGAFDILQKGYCSTTTNQGCQIDADCPAGETCKTFNCVGPGDPKGNGGNQLRVNLAIGAGSVTGVTPAELTVNRIRFDLACVANSGFPCTGQANVVQYGGDATITTTCAGVSWTSTTAQGGNEIVFAASQPIIIPQNCNPRSAVPCGNCELEFTLSVQGQEPSGSDATPQVVEEVAGYTNGAGDATCSATLQSGSSQTADLPICPSCTSDECNLGCEQTTGTCTPQPASTPCADTDGNSCTTAGCELNASSAGVCVQTHMLAENSMPCPDSDGNACTTAGCSGAGAGDQNHMSKTCPGADECNGGCDTTTGQCTPKTSTPCTDSDGNVCTIAGCEISPTNAELGVCVQTHTFATDSTPCPATDNDACTTPGCNGAGVCDQNHMTKTCPAADECNGGCDATSGQCTPKTSTPCTAADGAVGTIAGCEVSPTNSELGVCVQSHVFAIESAP